MLTNLSVRELLVLGSRMVHIQGMNTDSLCVTIAVILPVVMPISVVSLVVILSSLGF